MVEGAKHNVRLEGRGGGKQSHAWRKSICSSKVLSAEWIFLQRCKRNPHALLPFKINFRSSLYYTVRYRWAYFRIFQDISHCLTDVFKLLFFCFTCERRLKIRARAWCQWESSSDVSMTVLYCPPVAKASTPEAAVQWRFSWCSEENKTCWIKKKILLHVITVCF